MGDLNGDGNPDVVVADTLANTVSVLLGNGDSTFQSPRQFAVGVYVANPLTRNGFPTYRREVKIGDFDGDHLPDLVVANPDSADISVLLGRGDGTFEPQRRVGATPNPISVGVGDFNGDGRLDVAVLDQSPGPRDFAVLLGRGDGTFATHYSSVPISLA